MPKTERSSIMPKVDQLLKLLSDFWPLILCHSSQKDSNIFRKSYRDSRKTLISIWCAICQPSFVKSLRNTLPPLNLFKVLNKCYSSSMEINSVSCWWATSSAMMIKCQSTILLFSCVAWLPSEIWLTQRNNQKTLNLLINTKRLWLF